MLCILSHFVYRLKNEDDLESQTYMQYLKDFESNGVKSAANEADSNRSVSESDTNETKPTLITKWMYENKGLLKQRSHYQKEQNPRLKQKRRFQKALMT